MSQMLSTEPTPQPESKPDDLSQGSIILPPTLRSRFNGQLNGQQVVAWSEFDLTDQNAFAQQFVVLTEEKLITLPPDGAGKSFPLTSITEAKIVEGLGVDRLDVMVGETRSAALRYSRRHRREMTRLHRKLQRRLPGKKDDGAPASWLEAVEREAEKLDVCLKCHNKIPAYAEGVCPQCLHKRQILWRMLDVARPYRARIWLGLWVTLVYAFIQVLPPWLTKHLIDQGAINLDKSAVLYWSVALGVTFIAMEILGGIRLYVLATVGTNVARDLRHQVYAHMHELSLRFFAKRRTGSLITRVTNDTDRLWDFIVFGSVDFIRNILMIIFIGGMMLLLSWKMALITLAPLPIVAVLTYLRSRKLHAMWGRLWTYWSRMGAVVGDALPGVRVVKAFANEGREISRFDSRSNEYTQKEQEIHKAWTSLGPVVGGTMRLGGVLVWLVGGYLVVNNGNQEPYTAGTLVAFTGYLAAFYGPIMELVNSNRMVTRAATSAQRVFEILDTPPEIYSKTGAVKKDRLDGRVELRNVSFSYEGAQPALREVSLAIDPGQMIGLAGPSGAGKSTFVNLLSRFYDVTDGQILIDGLDIRDYDVKWLRRQIGMVLQEPYLFHGTVAENIRYGNEDASDAEVITAAKAANAHDFVVGFPDGYDTMVGERGQSLSGGERQRISIARAILHNPRILILDEATSSVDSETEKQIQQALDRLVEGRTTFAIAHRLSTLQAAHRLVVLDKGKIAEQGTHSELVSKPGGVYAKLHQTQVEMSAQVAIR